MSLFGAQLIQEGRNESDYRYDTIGANSTTFAVGDPVSLSSGTLIVATATSNVVGVCAKAVVTTSNNQTVAKVTVPFIPISESSIFLMGANGSFTGNATDGGTYYKITGTTGAVQVDQASGVQTTTSRVVEIVKVDPQNASDLTQVAVRFVKTPYENVQITA